MRPGRRTRRCPCWPSSTRWRRPRPGRRTRSRSWRRGGARAHTATVFPESPPVQRSDSSAFPAVLLQALRADPGHLSGRRPSQVAHRHCARSCPQVSEATHLLAHGPARAGMHAVCHAGMAGLKASHSGRGGHVWARTSYIGVGEWAVRPFARKLSARRYHVSSASFPWYDPICRRVEEAACGARAVEEQVAGNPHAGDKKVDDLSSRRASSATYFSADLFSWASLAPHFSA